MWYDSDSDTLSSLVICALSSLYDYISFQNQNQLLMIILINYDWLMITMNYDYDIDMIWYDIFYSVYYADDESGDILSWCDMLS